jgi:transposase
MPHLSTLINLPDFEVDSVEGHSVVYFSVHHVAPIHCPHCSSNRYKIKQTFIRVVRHTNIGSRASYLKILSHRFLCKQCRRSFNQRFSGIQPHQRASEPFREGVFEDHNNGVPQSVLEKTLRLGHATIERWYHYFIERRWAERKNNPAPKVLGLDEHFFTKHQGYATTFANLSSHKVHDVVLGKSEFSLESYLKNMPGRLDTELVLMDLSSTYRALAKKYFPNAKIVADRFHVIRLINKCFMKAYMQMSPAELESRGLRVLMRYHEWNLDSEKHDKLRSYLRSRPVLEAMYDFKQRLCRLLLIKRRTVRQTRHLIPKYLLMVKELKKIPIPILRRLGRTLFNWREEITRMWRYLKTNSITEGLHTKMEMINRRAYGFKSFENYRLRVRALCG